MRASASETSGSPHDLPILFINSLMPFCVEGKLKQETFEVQSLNLNLPSKVSCFNFPSTQKGSRFLMRTIGRSFGESEVSLAKA